VRVSPALDLGLASSKPKIVLGTDSEESVGILEHEYEDRRTHVHTHTRVQQRQRKGETSRRQAQETKEGRWMQCTFR
jgi:hypothetical protein